jgi:ABC-type Fe3+-hydroxamate transport system substrate-binding protein
LLPRILAWACAPALALLAACGRAAPPAGPLVLVDDAGDTVRLARPAVRVASLIPATTELMFALGAGGQTVGRTAWCDWPAEAAALPNLGDGIGPSVEAILGASPDLVLLYHSARNALAVERLRDLGIPTLRLRTDTFEDMARNLRLLGRATGHAAAAESLVARTDSALAALARPVDSSAPRVLILGWDQPPMTIGRGSFLHEIVTLAGGRNIFGDLPTPDAPVSLEAIARRDPDLILTTSESPAFARRPEWQVVDAVRRRRFVQVSGSQFSRPSPRAPEAVRWLAAVFDSLARR